MKAFRCIFDDIYEYLLKQSGIQHHIFQTFVYFHAECNAVKFWYNSLAFTEKCLSYDKQSNDKTAVLRTSGYHLGGKHA